MKIVISEKGKRELENLRFDIKEAIHRILGHIPSGDLARMSYILVTDLPSNKKQRNNKAMGSYFEKYGNTSAHIEIYLKNLFGHLKSVESFQEMLPIQEFALAQTIYHEFGHHIQHIRSHRVKRHQKERFAASYAGKIINNYILDNAESINDCFDHLESVARDEGLSVEIIGKMRAGWERVYKEAIA